MTSPIRPPVKSLDGRSARELFGIERTTDDGGDSNPPVTGSPVPPVTTLNFQTGGDVDVFISPPVGESDTLWPELRYDARGNNQVRVVTNVETIGAAGGELFAQYNGGGGWATPGAAGASVAQSIAVVGPRPTRNQGWVDLDPVAIADMLWRLRQRGGDSAASPALWGSHLQFRNKILTRPPLGADPVWGSLVFRLNANGDLFRELGYPDGGDVNLFPDETGIGHDFVTAGALLLPTYQANGITGGLPCVRWAGGNVPMTTPDNPTEPYGNYTYYFVAEGLDGGDGARLWGHTGGDSFQYSMYFEDDQISAANNNLFGAPSITILDDWDMSAKHIYRWVKWADGSFHFLFVDGVLKGSAANAPQTNNGGLIQLLSDMGGIGLSAKIGQIDAWNAAHLDPTGLGPTADGLTGPELQLQAYWGTP